MASEFFYLRLLAATMMLHMVPQVLPLSFALKIFQDIFRMSREIPYFE